MKPQTEIERDITFGSKLFMNKFSQRKFDLVNIDPPNKNNNTFTRHHKKAELVTM